MSKPNPLDHLAITNVLARYIEALDTKVFDLLDRVFSPDVHADYPFNSNLRSVDEVRSAIQNRLGPISTHHNLTTQVVVLSPSGTHANATTHFIGYHFGQGPHEGKVLTAYGRYVDELVCIPPAECKPPPADYETKDGSSGVWRIKKRTVVFTKRLGDEKIMSEF